MRKILTLFFIVVISKFCHSQEDTQIKIFAKILVQKQGVQKISLSTLKNFFNIDTINKKRLTLFNRGKKVPIFIHNEKIYFHAEQPGNTKYETYFLAESENGLFYEEVNPSNNTEFLQSQIFEKNEIFVELESDVLELLDKKSVHWLWEELTSNSNSFNFSFNESLVKNSDVSLKIFIQTAKSKTFTPNSFEVILNDRKIGRFETEKASYTNFEFQFKSDVMKNENTLIIKPEEKFSKDVYVDYFTLNFKRRFDKEKDKILLKFNEKYITINENTLSEPKVVSYLTDVNEIKKQSISADYIIITVSYLMKEAERIAEYRKKRGYNVFTVSCENLYDAFGYGNFSSDAIRDFLKFVYTEGKKLKFVLLIGDATYDVDFISDEEVLPTFIVETLLNGATASDHPFSDLVDKDILPEIAVGRIPARTPAELKKVIDGIIDYETKFTKTLDKKRFVFAVGEGGFGEGVDKALETIGSNLLQNSIPYDFDLSVYYSSPKSAYFYPPPDFSNKVVDEINKGCLSFVYIGHGQVDYLDYISWKGKYYPIITKNEGKKIEVKGIKPIVFFICCYAGSFAHYKKESLAEAVFIGDSKPIAVIASTSISHPYVNILIGISAIDAIKIVRDNKLRKHNNPTLGELYLISKTGILKSSNQMKTTVDTIALFILGGKYTKRYRDDHMYLYNLIGDPATILSIPKNSNTLTIDAPEFVTNGENLKVRVESSDSSIKFTDAIITLECSRDRILGKQKSVDLSNENVLEVVKENNKIANEKIILHCRIKLEDNKGSLAFQMPQGIPPGKYIIKVYAYSDEADAYTSKAISVREKER